MSKSIKIDQLFEISTPSDPLATLRKRLKHDGYLYFKRLIPKRQVNEAYKTALRLCNELGFVKSFPNAETRVIEDILKKSKLTVPQWRKVQTFGQEFTREKIYQDVSESKQLRALMAKILGGEVVLHPLRLGQLARTHLPSQLRNPMAIHQDFYFMGPPQESFSVWIPMMKCPIALGGLAILEGSHKLGPLPHRVERTIVPRNYKGRWLSTDFEAGDALIFNSLTVHGPLDNHTRELVRLAFDFRYCRADLFDESLLNHPKFGKVNVYT